MKAIGRTILLCLLIFVTGSLTGTRRAMAQGGVSVSFETFYNELAPYGRWVNYQDYGRVWVPDVEDDFQPYATRGRWVVTDYGNTWVSDYDWGWAPFHYGRWHHDSYYGWIWVPGSEWAPAWVHWRSGGGYYGWAPLGPGMDINININIPLLRWIFVPQRYITHHDVHRYYVPQRRHVNVYRSTTIINNIYVQNNHRYFYGPRQRDLERATGRRVQVHKIRETSRPQRPVASNGSLNVYRPSARPDRNERPSAENRPRPVGLTPSDSRNNAGRNENANATRPQRNERPASQRPEGAAPTVRDNAGRTGRDVSRSPRNERPTNQRPATTAPVAVRNTERKPSLTAPRETVRPVSTPTARPAAVRESRPQRASSPAQRNTPSVRQSAPAPQSSRPARAAQPASRTQRPSATVSRGASPSGVQRSAPRSSSRGERQAPARAERR